MPWVTIRYLQRRCRVVPYFRPFRISRYLHNHQNDTSPYKDNPFACQSETLVLEHDHFLPTDHACNSFVHSPHAILSVFDSGMLQQHFHGISPCLSVLGSVLQVKGSASSDNALRRHSEISSPIVFFLDGHHLCPEASMVVELVINRIRPQDFQNTFALDPVQRSLPQWVRLVPSVHDLWALHAGTY